MVESLTTVVLASNNPGKLREFKAMFAETAIDIIPQGEFKVEDAIEDGLSFVENAIIKARHASKATGLPAIADDSGLEVDYLKGAPGIYSARYSGEHGQDQAHNQLVLTQMQGVTPEQRSARFQCVLAFMRHYQDPTPLICQASWDGRILETERGNHGFGYDPIFWVPEYQCSSAELSQQQKNQLSHRGKALTQLLSALSIKYPL